jgi:hypothetical protein
VPPCASGSLQGLRFALVHAVAQPAILGRVHTAPFGIDLVRSTDNRDPDMGVGVPPVVGE